MTEIKIFRNSLGNIVKGELSGHTMNAPEGEDIVCASVSSALYMALNGIEKVVGEKFGYEIDDGYAFFVLSADIDDDKRKYTDVLLESMFLFFKDLSAQYPQNVNITELEV